MSRELPKSRAEAFSYQFEDDVKMLKSLSVLDNNTFDIYLNVLQSHIDLYKSAPSIQPQIPPDNISVDIVDRVGF
jgi:hypothetical protein